MPWDITLALLQRMDERTSGSKESVHQLALGKALYCHVISENLSLMVNSAWSEGLGQDPGDNFG